MSAPTEMELNRPITEPDPAWACKVAGCREPVPSDVEDQPHCEACHVPVCAVHVVTRRHVHLCPGCFKKQRLVMARISEEMKSLAHSIDICYTVSQRTSYGKLLDLNDVQFACERWMKEIGEVL